MGAEAFGLVVRIISIHYLPVFGKPCVADICALRIRNSHGICLPQSLPPRPVDPLDNLLWIHDSGACELLPRRPIHRKTVVLQGAIIVGPKSLTDYFVVAFLLRYLLSPFRPSEHPCRRLAVNQYLHNVGSFEECSF